MEKTTSLKAKNDVKVNLTLTYIIHIIYYHSYFTL